MTATDHTLTGDSLDVSERAVLGFLLALASRVTRLLRCPRLAVALVF